MVYAVSNSSDHLLRRKFPRTNGNKANEDTDPRLEEVRINIGSQDSVVTKKIAWKDRAIVELRHIKNNAYYGASAGIPGALLTVGACMEFTDVSELDSIEQMMIHVGIPAIIGTVAFAIVGIFIAVMGGIVIRRCI